jgi:hypothetical protein
MITRHSYLFWVRWDKLPKNKGHEEMQWNKEQYLNLRDPFCPLW